MSLTYVADEAKSGRRTTAGYVVISTTLYVLRVGVHISGEACPAGSPRVHGIHRRESRPLPLHTLPAIQKSASYVAQMMIFYFTIFS
jgi:hypothetical protein